jgi:hypothetical protein
MRWCWVVIVVLLGCAGPHLKREEDRGAPIEKLGGRCAWTFESVSSEGCYVVESSMVRVPIGDGGIGEDYGHMDYSLRCGEAEDVCGAKVVCRCK